MGEAGALSFLGIVVERCRCSYASHHMVAAKTHQVSSAEVAGQQPAPGVAVELPFGTFSQAPHRRQGRQRECLWQQQLCRAQAFQLGQHRRFCGDFEHGKATAAHIQSRNAEVASGGSECYQQIVSTGLQQGFIAHSAWGHHPHHLAFHWPFTGSGIADLFADGHRNALAHQFSEISLGGVIGHSCHRDRLAGGFAPCGQGYIKHPRRGFSVVEEEFVEIPHAVEHQLVRVLCFDAQVLLHHRGVLIEKGIFGHGRTRPEYKSRAL